MAITKISNSGILTGTKKYDSMLAGNAAYDPGATWLIQRTTLSSSASSVTFSSIPSTYQHLQVRLLAKSTAATAQYVRVQFNNDTTTSNYKRHVLYGTGAVAGALADDSGYYATLSDNSTSNFGVGIFDIHDYTSTTKNKTVRGIYGFEANNTGNEQIGLSSAVWLSTSAITSIELDFFTLASDFASGTTIALYGFIGA